MANVTRWDPFTEMAGMRSLMDRLFDSSFGRLPVLRDSEELGQLGGFGIDVYETPEAYVVKAQVPGVDPKDVEITVEEDVLTIRGETKAEENVKEEQYLRRELRYGTFQRSLRLPPTADVDKAQASFENGVLKLSIPKKAEARPRTIKITPQGVIEGTKQS